MKNETSGMSTIPIGSRRMWGIGSMLTWPPCAAVSPPPSFAARAWAASWQVVDRRNATNHIGNVASTSVVNPIGGGAYRAAWILLSPSDVPRVAREPKTDSHGRLARARHGRARVHGWHAVSL